MAFCYQADAVIIGGGVIGTAVAHYLTRAGLRAALVEKHGVASGASGRCEGFVLVNDKMPGYDSRLAAWSQSLFAGIGDETGFDVQWHRTGSLLIAEDAAEMEMAAEFCGQLAAEGLPVQLLDANQTCALEPYLATDIAGTMLTDSDGAVNPMALAQGLARSARDGGGRLMAGTEVRSIGRTRTGAIERVITDGGDILTDTVINAAGVGAPAVGRMVGVAIPITPRQGQILVTERTFAITGRKMMEFGYLATKFHREGYRRRVDAQMEENGVAFVFEPTGAGNFLIGSSRRFSGFDRGTDLAVLGAVARRAARFYPVLKQVRIIRSYAGVRPYTPDHFPIVSKTAVPGFFVAAGHEGNGITLCLATGKLMAEMVTGAPMSMDVGPLCLERFAADGSA